MSVLFKQQVRHQPTLPALLNWLCTLFIASPLLLLAPSQAQALPDKQFLRDHLNIDKIYVYRSFYTKHFDPEPYHVNEQDMFGLEMRATNQWMYGFVTFDNSFGQPSEYLYTGYKWNIGDASLFNPSYKYFKLTGGLMHGYKDEYADKIPFNGLGVAPAVIPTLGYQYKNYVSEVSLGGLSVFTVTLGYAF